MINSTYKTQIVLEKIVFNIPCQVFSSMNNQIDEEDAQVLANVRAHFSSITKSHWDLRIHTKLKPQLNSDDCGVFGKRNFFIVNFVCRAGF